MWGRFSVSHQRGASIVHKIDTDTSKVLVLGLRALSKSSMVHQGELPTVGCPQTFVVWQGLRETSG